MRFLDATDLEHLADEMPTERDRVLTMLLGWTGLRAGEALALRRGDVDVLRVALPTFLAEMVAGSMPTEGLVFPNRDGEYLYETNWKRRVFDPAAKRAGLTPPPLRVHDLRHTAASFAIVSGASVKAVQLQLGHRSATVRLDRYAHPWPDELDALGGGLERLRSPAPADSLRTLETDATVIPLGTRRDLHVRGGAGRTRTCDRRIMSPLL
jgi:integrase